MDGGVWFSVQTWGGYVRFLCVLCCFSSDFLFYGGSIGYVVEVSLCGSNFFLFFVRVIL